MQFRTEHDPLGEYDVPADAYYGIQTARAVDNFRISDLRAPADLIVATVLVKRAAAEANEALQRLDARVAGAIVRACDEIRSGALRDQFVVDIYQAGAGTSHNMNANEVIANRAAELLGGSRGDYSLVHPNDHVNMGQSTNDVFPTATRLALLIGMRPLVDAARGLASALREKADAFANVLKVGRTHLQDAVPMTLGQEFGGYAACIDRGADDVEQAAEQLKELNLGATAVGTGLNAGDDYSRLAISNLSRALAVDLVPAANRFRVTQSMGDVVAYSGAMRRLAVELSKVASDLRLLSSGPRAGIAEIVLPAVQPGSSIMPGKVNPSIAEMVNQVCCQVIGCDATVCNAGEAGQLELNVMMPCHRLERAPFVHDPGERHEHAGSVVRRRYPGGRHALPRAAGSQHRCRDGTQPVSRVREDRGNCERIGAERKTDSRSCARTRAHRRRTTRSNSLRRCDD
jgi:aspartate ammonia-lyase